MCDVLDKVENRGIEKGIVKGESRGENKMALLVKKLLDQNRIDDVKRASEDEKSRAELMKELGSTEKLKTAMCRCFERSVILAPAQAAIKNPRK